MTYLFVRVHSAQIASVAVSCFACVALLAGRSTASLARRTMVQAIYKILADAAYDAKGSSSERLTTFAMASSISPPPISSLEHWPSTLRVRRTSCF